MKPGKLVTYRDARGATSVAYVAAVVGSGASGYKLLDLRVGSEARETIVEAVAHEGDAERGEAVWALPDEHAVEVPPVAPVEPEHETEHEFDEQ